MSKLKVDKSAFKLAMEVTGTTRKMLVDDTGVSKSWVDHVLSDRGYDHAPMKCLQKAIADRLGVEQSALFTIGEIDAKRHESAGRGILRKRKQGRNRTSYKRAIKERIDC